MEVHMGTQQLLLIVLGLMIVGIAVAISLTIFGMNAEQANRDAIVQDCLRFVSSAKTFSSKPTMLGGGGNSFEGIDISDCGMNEIKDANGSTLNGTYEITKASRKDFIIEARSATNSQQSVQVKVHMYCNKHDDSIEIEYAGWN